ncbi:MAG: hypothetical protein H7A25_18020 [Leptospiraceae bacterium]|nr:hypothetical protein [Leptospiraceae bacterium]MCP5501806.1 hypothetical protein [Leptospiraceae bacterium]
MKRFLILFCSLGILSQVFSHPSQLPLGALKFKLDGKEYYIPSRVQCVLETRRGNSQLFIDLLDTEQKIKFSISVNYNASLSHSENHFSSEYNSLTAFFNSPDGGFLIYPAVVLRPDEQSKDWKGLSREERIWKGKGVSVSKEMQGLVFYLNTIPVSSKGSLVELQGSFSGIVKLGSRESTHLSELNEGEFRVPVSITPDKPLKKAGK